MISEGYVSAAGGIDRHPEWFRTGDLGVGGRVSRTCRRRACQYASDSDQGGGDCRIDSTGEGTDHSSLFPHRLALFAAFTLFALAYSSALAACTNGIVLLGAGSYHLADSIYISHSNVTLRGAGPGSTILSFEGSAKYIIDVESAGVTDAGR